MDGASLSFSKLWDAWVWEPIANCPGRYRLVTTDVYLPISVLVGEGACIQVHRVPAARDEVLVAGFSDGGIISYHRPNGTWVHTLNTVDGFNRKLCQLGL